MQLTSMRTSKQSLYVLIFATAVLLLMSPALLADEKKIMRTPHIFDSSTDRTPAVTAFPKYPRIARRDRIEGDTTVCFMIDARGRIRRARVEATTHAIFKRAALRAIRASSFAPLAPHELLASARTCRTYRFRLNALPMNASEES